MKSFSFFRPDKYTFDSKMAPWCAYLVFLSVLLKFHKSLTDQNIWHSYQFDASYAREELVITDVTADSNFTLRREVVFWKSLSANGRVYAVGLLDGAVAVLNAKLTPDGTSFVISEKVTEFNWNLTDLEVFEHWNIDTKKPEVILILSTCSATAPELHWYQIKDNELQHFWTWHVHQNVTHIRHFQLDDDKYRLLILKDTKSNNLDLYEFVLNPSNNEFWLSQSLSLTSPANSSAFNFYGSDFYLSIPQKEQNEVRVYKSEDAHFKLYNRIKSDNVKQISSFRIGFNSYLTIAGENGGIYRFAKDTIELEGVHGVDLNNVDFWLPVPIKTYRDEVALILQRALRYNSHGSFALEVVTYDGQRFSVHDEAPCHYYGEAMHGLDCMIDEEGHLGISGATVLSIKDVLGVLVPHKNNSVLYMVRTTLKSLKSPIELEIEKLIDTRNQLQKMIEEQQAHIEFLRNPTKKPPTSQITTDSLSSTESSNISQETINAAVPESNNLKLDLDELRNQIKDVGTHLDDTKNMLSKVIILNGSRSHLENVTLYGQLKVLGKTEINNLNAVEFNNDNVQDVFDDLVRRKHLGKIFGVKTFTNLKVENITAEIINGFNVGEFIANDQTVLTVDQNALFDKPVTVHGNVIAEGAVNKFDLINEVVEMSKQYEDHLDFEHVKIGQKLTTLKANNFTIPKSDDDLVKAKNPFDEMNTVEILGNITVKNVNGENFEQFMQSLRFTNSDVRIPGNTVIKGEVNVVHSADVQFINGLRFPDEYLLKSSEFVTFTGQKQFFKPLATNQLILENTINGIKPENIMTLTTNQTIMGKYIFNDLEVMKMMHIGGEVVGPHINRLLPNPTLLDARTIESRVNIKSLEVDGTIHVANNFNGKNIEEMLQDVVYKDEEVANIASIKNFSKGFSVSNGMKITSGLINDIPVESFMTKNTDQEIVLKTLNGRVIFENIVLHGLYSKINITKLEEETVKLSGNQFVPGTLVFINSNESMVDLSANEMEILDSLNGFSSTDFFNKNDNIKIPNGSFIMEKLRATNVVVEGNIEGQFADFSVAEFDAKRLSVTRPQEVTAQYTVKSLYSENFHAEIINGEVFQKVFDHKYFTNEILNSLIDGKLKIKKLDVNGSAFIENMNGRYVKDMIKYYLWTNRNNDFNSAIFLSDVSVYHLNLQLFNGVDFQTFFNNIVYKTDPNIFINGFKTFNNGFHVTTMLNSERLNDVHVDNILTKTGPQYVEGPLIIYGNVVVENDCQIEENLNGVFVSNLSKTYNFRDDTLEIKDDLMFERLPYINKLIVEGYVNAEHLDDFFENIIYKDQNSKILGKVTFENNVQVNQNLIVSKNINGVDFSEFVQDMVLTTVDATIDKNITFTDAVYVGEELIVDANLDTRYLNEIDLDRWKYNTAFINRGIIPGRLIFDHVTVQGNVYSNYVNDVDLKSLIPLRSTQYINQTLEFAEIDSFHNISVKNKVNGHDLPDEFHNTVMMTNLSQQISSPITFKQNVMIRSGVDVLGLVNGKNLRYVVTLDTEQNLTADYEFDAEVLVQSDLVLDGLLNNINVMDWSQNSVKVNSEGVQVVSDSWSTDDRIVFGENVEGKSLIRGFDVHELANAMEEKRLVEIMAENSVTRNYVNMCEGVNDIIDIAQNQIFLFKYLEYLEKFTFNNHIQNVHHFKAGSKDYVLITEINACASHLLEWTNLNFAEISIVETGSVSQMVTVYDDSLVFLISRSDMSVRGCKYSGTYAWRFVQGDLIPLYNLDDFKLLQESLTPRTFYAMSKDFVTEYRLVTTGETNIKIYRKWEMNTENFKFVPRGIGTGLALSNGNKLYKLVREEFENEDDFSYDTEAIIRGNIVEENNIYLPGHKHEDVIVMNVGFRQGTRSLVAIATHEETSVKGKLDFIKIYEDALSGKLFHKVPTYKPSSLLSIEFGNNGETLLIFMEDEQVLQVYEYKGKGPN
ncbi:hypothetical protein FQA39_LY02052 [Lamprigera yunnana]|nr:hypothetical protein FQA39_LY02052 [Lamprigera yunnana]